MNLKHNITFTKINIIVDRFAIVTSEVKVGL
jgi:hypothetical protein